MHMTYLKDKMSIYLAWKSQIASLLAKKIFVLKKYLDFTDIFSKKSVAKLFKYFNINKYAINLKPSKQLFYILIYNL